MTKVHVEVAKLHREGYEFIMIGHKGHPEVEGTMGQLSEGIYLVEEAGEVQHVRPRGDKLAVVTQTTLSVDDAAAILAEVKRRFPRVREPKQQDICYATQNRQDAVKVMAPQVDVVIVVGSPTSSNSNRLRELAERLGTEAHMVEGADDLQPVWFEGRRRVGLTAGASAPDVLVQAVTTRLREMGLEEGHLHTEAQRLERQGRTVSWLVQSNAGQHHTGRPRHAVAGTLATQL